eukprot:387448-Prymnesium_polylepis.1
MIVVDDAAVRARLAVSDASLARAKGFCEGLMQMPVVRKSADEIRALARAHAIFQVTLLYEWLPDLAGDALVEAYKATHGAAFDARALELAGLMGEN